MTGYIGQQLGTYRLLQHLGQRDAADIYMGEQIYTGTQVVIKVLHAHLGSQEAEHFRQEAARVARLEHPQIVDVLDFGVEETTAYLILGSLPERTVRDLSPAGVALPLPPLLAFVRQLADALQYAHTRGLVHAALKPENIFVGMHNALVLSDFGTALIVHFARSGQPRDGADLAYMAPEQIEGHLSAASDQYALGILAYEWLCGFCPFQGAPADIAYQQARTPPPSLHERLPGLPSAVESVLFTALAKDPARRFSSIERFAQAFEQAASQFPVQPRGASPLEAGGPEASTIFLNAEPTPFRPVVGGLFPPPAARPPAVAPSAALPARMASLPSPPASLQETRLAAGARSGSAFPVERGGSASSDMPPPLRRSLKWTSPLLVLLALLVIGGGIGGSLFYISHMPRPEVQRPQLPPFQVLQTAIVHQQAVHRKQVSAYNTFVLTNGGMFGFDMQHTRFNPFEVILDSAHLGVVQAWTAATGAEIGQSSPVVADGVVYIGSHDGKLYAFDAVSGQLRWVALTRGPLDSSPAVANGLVYIGSEDHSLYAFDSQTGQKRWAYATTGPISSSPVLAEGVVYIASKDGALSAIDGWSGTKKWVVATDGAGISSSPVVSGGQIYVASLSGTVYAFNRNGGKRLWRATSIKSPISSSPAVANGLIYLGSYDQKLHALDEKTGKQRWVTQNIGAISASPAVAYMSVYISTRSGSLYAFSSLTGKQRWVNHELNTSNSSPFVADRLVYLGTKSNGVLAFDVSNGKQQGEMPVKAAVNDSPTVANGVIYLGAADGHVYAFHRA